MIVFIISMSNDHATFLQIDFSDVAIEKVRAAQKLAHGIDNVGQIKVTCRNFMQHRCEQKEVLAIDKRKLNIRVATKRLLKTQGRIKTAEAAPKNQDSRSLV